MPNYPALVDGEDGAYGVTFPDLPGIVAMGKTVEEAISNAEEALHDYAIEADADGAEVISPSTVNEVDLPCGQRLVVIPLAYRDPSGASAS